MIYVAVVQPGSDTDIDENNPIHATSVGFTVTAPHLVILKQPTASSVGEAVPFTVELENFKNQPVDPKGSGGTIGVELSTIGVPVQDAPESLVNSSFDNTRISTGNTAIVAPYTATFSISANLMDGSGGIVSTTPTVTSVLFSVVPAHLVFKSQPKTTSAGQPIPFQVQLEDLHNKVIPPPYDDQIMDVLAHTTDPTIDPGVSEEFEFTKGTFSNLPYGPDALALSLPTTYTITAELLQNYDGPDERNFTPVTSKVFKII